MVTSLCVSAVAADDGNGEINVRAKRLYLPIINSALVGNLAATYYNRGIGTLF